MEDKSKIITLTTHDQLVTTSFFRDYEWVERMYDETFQFEKGKSYGILCEIGEGGGGISWLLSGREEIEEEEITVFGRKYSQGERVQEGWFITGIGISGMNKTLEKELKIALKQSGLGLSVDDIVEKFGLTPERLKVKMRHFSWEGWRASVAIGYAMGKQIFCFPWLNPELLMEMVLSTAYCFYVDKLKKEDAIVIVPSSDRRALEEMTDEIIQLDNSVIEQFTTANFYKYMEKYRNKQHWYQNL